MRATLIAATVALAVACAPAGESGGPAEDRVDAYRRAPGPAAFAALYDSIGASGDSLAAALERCRLHLVEIERCLDTLRARHDELDRGGRRHFAQIQLDMGRTREAVPLFETLCAGEPDYACPWHKLGVAYLRLGRPGESLECMRKACEIASTHRSCFDDLARTLLALERPAEALAAFEEGCRNTDVALGDPDREPIGLDAEFLYLDLLERCGKEERAALQLARLRREAPEDERLARD